MAIFSLFICSRNFTITHLIFDTQLFQTVVGGAAYNQIGSTEGYHKAAEEDSEELQDRRLQ